MITFRLCVSYNCAHVVVHYTSLFEAITLYYRFVQYIIIVNWSEFITVNTQALPTHHNLVITVWVIHIMFKKHKLIYSCLQVSVTDVSL